MKRSSAAKNPTPIDQQIRSTTGRLLVFMGLMQLLAMAVAIGVLSFRDAKNRASFLANSNSEALGLMLSSGDKFGLRSQLKSFRSSETFVWILTKNNEDIAALGQAEGKERIDLEAGTIFWKGDGLFLKTTFPIMYHGNFLGTFVFLNKLKFFDTLILSLVFIAMTSLFYLVQSKYLERFAFNLARSIQGLSHYFKHSNSSEDLDGFQQQRNRTNFLEVEEMAGQMHELLGKILETTAIEREREKYKAIAQVTAHVAHDLRHPISVFASVRRVQSWNDFLLLKEELPGALQRIDNMIEGLRYSDAEILIRLSPGKIILSDLASAVRPIAREKGMLVRCEGNVQDLELSMDEGKLPRAINNLLFNAMESGATEIILRANLIDDTYVIEVSDNGPGVPEHFISKLFSIGSTHGKQSGSGLGLAFCKKVIEAHGGSINYRRQDQETTFVISLKRFSTLNLIPATRSDTVTRLASSAPSSPCRVLIRISNAQVQDEIVLALTSNGIATVSDELMLQSHDLICSDDESIIHSALERNISVILYNPSSPMTATVSTILKRWNLMEQARRKVAIDEN